MRLLFIRHAEAEDQDLWAKTGQSDDARPLTRAGRKEMRKGVQGLHASGIPIDTLATSPLVRAVETAQIVSDAYQGPKPTELDELSPGKSPAAILRWLRTQPAKHTIALVGHEPHLSTCISYLLTGHEKPIVKMKKSGACLLDFPGEVAAGHAVLNWLMEPRQLRQQRK